jgi:hypothetical protein
MSELFKEPITCHHTETQEISGLRVPARVPLTWERDGKHGVRCPVCHSIDPDFFVFLLEDQGFLKGWTWDGDTPLHCQTVDGRFYATHLIDQPVEWLREHAMTIFLATGVLFFWKRDHLKCLASTKRKTYSIESPFRPSQATVERFQKKFDEYFK